MKKIILLSTIILLLFACSEKNKKYNEQLNNYLNSELDINIKDINNQSYIFLFIGGCGECMIQDLISFNTFPKKNDISIVIVGQNEDNRIDSIINIYTSKYQIVYDRDETIFEYETGIVSNSYLIIENKKIKKVINIKHYGWDNLYEDYFN